MIIRPMAGGACRSVAYDLPGDNGHALKQGLGPIDGPIVGRYPKLRLSQNRVACDQVGKLHRICVTDAPAENSPQFRVSRFAVVIAVSATITERNQNQT
jgi:hypothetical protein